MGVSSTGSTSPQQVAPPGPAGASTAASPIMLGRNTESAAPGPKRGTQEPSGQQSTKTLSARNAKFARALESTQKPPEGFDDFSRTKQRNLLKQATEQAKDNGELKPTWKLTAPRGRVAPLKTTQKPPEGFDGLSYSHQRKLLRQATKQAEENGELKPTWEVTAKKPQRASKARVPSTLPTQTPQPGSSAQHAMLGRSAASASASMGRDSDNSGLELSPLNRADKQEASLNDNGSIILPGVPGSLEELYAEAWGHPEGSSGQGAQWKLVSGQTESEEGMDLLPDFFAEAAAHEAEYASPPEATESRNLGLGGGPGPGPDQGEPSAKRRKLQ